MSATGSVNLIVCFSLSHPFAPRPAENLQRLVHQSFVVRRLSLACSLVVANDQPPATSDALPGRLRNAWNLPAQRQLTEAQSADAELPQEPPRTSAKLAAVMSAGGEDSSVLANAGFAVNCTFALADRTGFIWSLGVFLMQPDAVFNSFCCSCHSILLKHCNVEL
jgi:hypothetical protein